MVAGFEQICDVPFGSGDAQMVTLHSVLVGPTVDRDVSQRLVPEPFGPRDAASIERISEISDVTTTA